MLRWMANLCWVLIFLLAILTVWCQYRPIHIQPYDYRSHSWFPKENYWLPQTLSDLNEPGPDGPLGASNWDFGLFPNMLYVRKSVYVPSQVWNGTDWEDVDAEPYQPDAYQLPLGIVWKQVWHQGATSAFVAIPVWILFVILLCCPAFGFGAKCAIDICQGIARPAIMTCAAIRPVRNARSAERLCQKLPAGSN